MSSRSTWSGAISFGLVVIPVKLFTTIKDEKVKFRQTCTSHNARIQYHRVCVAAGEEVAYADLGRAYEMAGGELLPITDEDLAGLQLSTAHRVEVVQFVPGDQLLQFLPEAPLNPVAFEKAYFIAPDKGGEKAYRLLAEAMNLEGKVAVAKFALRQKEQVAIIVPFGGNLLLQLLHWPEEVKSADDLKIPAADVSDAEIKMARGLIGAMTEDFDPAAWTNKYEQALAEVIAAKQDGKVLEAPVTAGPPAEVADLTALLAASIDAQAAAKPAPVKAKPRARTRKAAA
jgi:DNA end-binding protein Ku